jgi:hypothetical protein
LQDNKTQHDFAAALRFLEHLYQEITLAKQLEDLQDPNILMKFKSILDFLKKQRLSGS